MPPLNPLVGEAWLWLGSSLILAMLWTNLAWLFSPWTDPARPIDARTSLAENIVSRLANWRFAPILYQVLRLLYYVGLPSAALFWGRDAIVRRFAGLKRLALPPHAGGSTSGSLSSNWSAWAQDLGWAAILGLSTGALLLLSAFVHRQALSNASRGAPSAKASAWKAAREALYLEIHWAFYRNAPMVALGTYWGVWAGLGLAALEAVINPPWRQGLREPGQAWSRVSQGALAVVSGTLFLRAQNFWLALVLHWGLSWALGTVYKAPSSALSDVVPSGE